MSIFSGKATDVVVNEDLKIPGDSPLEFCPGDHSADIVKIDKVDLLPNPPKAYDYPARLLSCSGHGLIGL